MSNKQAADHDMVKKQTLIFAVILSLSIGFVGGAVFSSIKLGSPISMTGKPEQMTAQPEGNQGMSDAIATKILQLEQYLKTNPKDGEAWTQLGNLLFDSDQYANAIEAYQKSLAIDPNQIGVITDMGVMYRRNKQPEKAIETFDKAIALDPKFETARFNKGIVLLHDLGDAAGGIKVWEELVRINPLAMAPNGESVDAIVQRMKQQKGQ